MASWDEGWCWCGWVGRQIVCWWGAWGTGDTACLIDMCRAGCGLLELCMSDAAAQADAALVLCRIGVDLVVAKL